MSKADFFAHFTRFRGPVNLLNWDLRLSRGGVSFCTGLRVSYLRSCEEGEVENCLRKLHIKYGQQVFKY